MNNNFSRSAIAITNLMYRYNELIDAGDFEEASDIFSHAKLKLVTKTDLGSYLDFLDMLQRVIRVYPDGTPRTKHLVTNPILEIDEENGKAIARSHYTVFQKTENLPFQAIAGGRYHDEFEYVNGKWRFTYRDFTLFDFQGEIGHHLNLDAF